MGAETRRDPLKMSEVSGSARRMAPVAEVARALRLLFLKADDCTEVLPTTRPSLRRHSEADAKSLSGCQVLNQSLPLTIWVVPALRSSFIRSGMGFPPSYPQAHRVTRVRSSSSRQRLMIVPSDLVATLAHPVHMHSIITPRVEAAKCDIVRHKRYVGDRRLDQNCPAMPPSRKYAVRCVSHTRCGEVETVRKYKSCDLNKEKGQ